MHECRSTDGYTLIELIVALLLFSIGGLALCSTAAVVGRQLNVDALRQRAGRVATSKLESLRAGCATAASGADRVSGIASSWSVTSDGMLVSVTEQVRYASWEGEQVDVYTALFACP